MQVRMGVLFVEVGRHVFILDVIMMLIILLLLGTGNTGTASERTPTDHCNGASRHRTLQIPAAGSICTAQKWKNQFWNLNFHFGTKTTNLLTKYASWNWLSWDLLTTAEADSAEVVVESMASARVSSMLRSSDELDDMLVPPPDRRSKPCEGDWRIASPPRDASSALERAADVSSGSCGGMACPRKTHVNLRNISKHPAFHVPRTASYYSSTSCSKFVPRLTLSNSSLISVTRESL